MINAIMKKLFQRELKVLMDDKYRGYGIKLLGGGFQLYYDNKLEGTYQTCYDDKENLQKAKNTIDSKYKEINHIRKTQFFKTYKTSSFIVFYKYKFFMTYFTICSIA